MDIDFIKSLTAGLSEARKGLVYYTSASYLAEELGDLWNPRPVVREEEAASFHYSIEAPAMAPLPEVASPAPKRPPPWFVGMSSAFSKDIVKIDRKLQGRILEALVKIAENPTDPGGV